MKTRILIILFLTFFSYSEGYSQTKKAPKEKSTEMMLIEPSCDTLTVRERRWDEFDAAYLWLSIYCFPIPSDPNNYVLGWDPVTRRVTQLDKDWFFPSQLGNAGKVLSTDGVNRSWVSQSTYSAGSGLSLSSGVFNNTAPDQTVILSGSNGVNVSGTYPNFTVAKSKRQETYSGTSNASGNYTVTFSSAYTVAPNIQVCLINPNVRDTPIVTVSSTGFTVNIQRRFDVVGLLPTYANVNGGAIDVLITEK